MNDDTPLGASEDLICTAESALGVRFPDTLRQAWMTYNCNALRGGWQVFPIFDVRNPRKTASHVVYENTKGKWEIMSDNLTAIADNGTGNRLVLKVVDGIAGDEVFYWDHETGRLTSWRPGLQSILETAKRSQAKVLNLRKKFQSKSSDATAKPLRS